MSWSDIWILYRRELRSALRERTIVVNSVLLPILLYPVLLWVMFSAFSFVEGVAERRVSRVEVAEVDPRHRALLDSLAAREDVEVRGGEAGGPETEAGVLERIRAGELDAWVTFRHPTDGGRSFPGNVRIRVVYAASEERSRRARRRVEDEVEAYRERWLAREAASRGIPPAVERGFDVVSRDVASDEERGAFLLSVMIPVFLVIMVAVGCLVPAVDTTAGERERSTWETLMTVQASRLSVVTSKYLYVATLGIAAGVLNVLAVFASLGAVLAPLLGEQDDVAFQIPLPAVPVMMAGAASLALFFAAAMMILAAFARTFKEGQGMVMPVYWLGLLPVVLIGQSTDQALTPGWAWVPLVNVTFMIKDAIRGILDWPLIVQAVAVELALVAVCLLVARSVLRFEDLLLGAYDGSFWRFARERLVPGATGRSA